ARALSLACPLGLVACLAGAAVRGIGGSRVGASLLAAAAGMALAGLVASVAGHAAVLVGSTLALGAAAAMQPDDAERPAPSAADAIAWAAGIAGGLAAAAFALRLRDVGAPSPVATGVVVGALVALGAGALVGLGLPMSRPRVVVAAIGAVLALAA